MWKCDGCIYKRMFMHDFPGTHLHFLLKGC